ncbi:phosphatidylinositol-3,5-bisphosphate 5-phosphatase [Rhizoclosmatium sp. JEL0117]|nr:phosphatidylinositol-3,5-bisphosphate 5-phosphatase [Rhizoclosmatium sp. JEL0117]
MVGSGADEDSFRILKIDRTLDSNGSLSVTEDQTLYSRQEMMELLSMIESGNAATGGLRRVASCFGIVGFVKFLEGYYMILITKRSAVALIGGHYIYHIDDTLILGISGPSERFSDRTRSSDEARYIQSFCQVDLSKNFYFSYTYDITNSLQRNMTCVNQHQTKQYNEMFMWNNFLLRNGFEDLNNVWCLPIIYGFVDQAKIPVFGHDIYLTLIARRSRLFAGARFLKRGVNDEGFVANEIETEQIVNDANTTLFEYPHSRFVNYVDPYFSATSLHFSNLFERYGHPIIVLNLIKSKEKTPREGILLPEFRDSVTYLNTHLPEEMKMVYVEWDMARANKSDDAQEVVACLERIAEDGLGMTGFFHAGREPYLNAVRRAELEAGDSTKLPTRILGRLQTGITRTNCIDCLDRTNAAQFMIGKCALAHQLYALGVIASPHVPFDSDAANLLNSMYQDHGDTIALQYGGSHLVNTMETYRKIGHWTSHSRDMIESIRRYYSNSFTDAEKQYAINLFLGNFRPTPNGPKIWDLPSDYYLHHDPNLLKRSKKRSYKKWWINPDTSPPPDPTTLEPTMASLLSPTTPPDVAFKEYYRPDILTSFDRLYASTMNPASRGAGDDHGDLDLSPFAVRNGAVDATTQILEYQDRLGPHAFGSGCGGFVIYGVEGEGVSKWLKGGHLGVDEEDDGDGEVVVEVADVEPVPWWTTSALSMRLLDPVVSAGEFKEYKRYVAQFKPAPVTSMRVPKLSSSKRSTPASHPDFEIFKSYVESAFPNPSAPLQIVIDQRDEEIYRNYVQQSGNVGNYSGDTTAGVLGKGETDEARYEAYAQWLATGKYH